MSVACSRGVIEEGPLDLFPAKFTHIQKVSHSLSRAGACTDAHKALNGTWQSQTPK